MSVTLSQGWLECHFRDRICPKFATSKRPSSVNSLLVSSRLRPYRNSSSPGPPSHCPDERSADQHRSWTVAAASRAGPRDRHLGREPGRRRTFQAWRNPLLFGMDQELSAWAGGKTRPRVGFTQSCAISRNESPSGVELQVERRHLAATRPTPG